MPKTFCPISYKQNYSVIKNPCGRGYHIGRLNRKVKMIQVFNNGGDWIRTSDLRAMNPPL